MSVPRGFLCQTSGAFTLTITQNSNQDAVWCHFSSLVAKTAVAGAKAAQIVSIYVLATR